MEVSKRRVLPAMQGPTYNSYPFGVNSAPFRYINLHDDLMGTPRVIRGMVLRRNAESAASAAYSVTLDLWVSTATTTATTANAMFDLNHGTDKLKVVTNKTMSFPQTFSGSVPDPFVFNIPWDLPFVFLGSAGLCWEAQISARTNTTSYYLDAVSGTGSTNPALAFTSFGTGCRATGANTVMTATGSGTMNWPAAIGTLSVTGAAGPANAPAALFFGLSNTTWNSLPLPLPIPSSGVGPSGPCNIYTDVVVTLPTMTGPTGTTSFSIPFTPTPALNGLRTFEQIVAIDPIANAFGLVSSNAVNHNVIAPYGAAPGARIFLLGSLGATGTVAANFCPVVRFYL